MYILPSKHLRHMVASIRHIWNNLTSRAHRVSCKKKYCFHVSNHLSTYQPCIERAWCLKTLVSYLSVLETRNTQMGLKGEQKKTKEMMNSLALGS